MNASQTRGRILLVDDHPDTLALQALFLRRRGYTVETANSTAAALAIAAETPLDLVVSDIRLGDGSGVELMATMSREYGLVGIAMTGVAEDEAIAAGADVGFARILVKPLPPEQLVEAIEAIIAGGNGG